VTAPKPLKQPCSRCSKPANVDAVTGLIKSHRRNGIKCPGTGKPPRRRG
jgi:hypothetical protein